MKEEPQITIVRVNTTTFDVTVKLETVTHHTVSLSEEYCTKLSGGKFSPETLIRKSFEFLLEREPNTSILNAFDLSDISRYFPEYETVIRGK